MFEKQEGLRTRTEHLASRNGVIENPPMGMDDLPLSAQMLLSKDRLTLSRSAP